MQSERSQGRLSVACTLLAGPPPPAPLAATPSLQVVFSTGGLRLRSVLAAAWGAEPPITNHTASFSGCLDYLWASQQHWQPVAALEMPYSWEAASAPPAAGAAGQLGDGRGEGQAGVDGVAAADPAAISGRLPPMPNERFPSDHLAVGAQLALHS